MLKAVTPANNATRKGYAGKKKRTNLSLDAELVSIAMTHFPLTSYGSLSAFVEAKLGVEFRAKAADLRKRRVKLPESLFAK